MKLEDALNSEKMYKRKNEVEWRHPNCPASFSVSDVLADDWEVQLDKVWVKGKFADSIFDELGGNHLSMFKGKNVRITIEELPE